MINAISILNVCNIKISDIEHKASHAINIVYMYLYKSQVSLQYTILKKKIRYKITLFQFVNSPVKQMLNSKSQKISSVYRLLTLD